MLENLYRFRVNKSINLILKAFEDGGVLSGCSKLCALTSKLDKCFNMLQQISMFMKNNNSCTTTERTNLPKINLSKSIQVHKRIQTAQTNKKRPHDSPPRHV